MSQPVDAAPRLSASEAEALAAERFGISGSARPLASERDQNFRLDAGSGERFVLKLANAEESEHSLAFQSALLERLAERPLGFALPRVVRARDGRTSSRYQAAPGRVHLARVLSWVEGEPLGEARTRLPPLLEDVGRCLGRLDRALEGFDHPGAQRALRWDLLRSAERRPALAHVADASRRALVERLLDRFDAELAPALRRLPAAVIHGDWHEHNILLSPAREPQRRVVGALDVGDALRAHRVCDPAIAIAYAMLGQPDPLAAAVHLARGYCAEAPLGEAELALLWELARMRLAISVLNAAEQAWLAPDNAYLRITEQPAWELLERLEALSPDWALLRLREAAGLEPHPGRGPVVAALARQPAFAPVLALDLGRAPVLDFSVESPDFEPPQSLQEVRAMSASIARRMLEAGAEVALGRYDEARIVYTSEAFRSGVGAVESWRSVHLGVDLFAPAGTAVCAPLDGVLHSFADNAAPLDYGPTLILEHRLAAGLVLFSLYGHLSRESLRGLEIGRRYQRGERIASLGDERVNGGWAPHLHFQLLLDTLGLRGDFPGVAAAAERSAWLALCPDPNLVLRLPALAAAPPATDRRALLESRRAHFSSALSLSYPEPLVAVRGRGARLYDADAVPHLDAVNNIAHVGHAHPRVVAALARQAALVNTNTRYLHPLRAAYLERLAGLFPDPLGVVFLVCSGSEANELALRLARAHTGARGVVVLEGGYHGNTSALIELSPYKYRGRGGRGPGPGVQAAPAPDAYRGEHRGPDAGARYAAQVAECVERAAREGSGPVTFIAESLPGCAGQLDPPPGFLAGAYRAVRAAGGVCVADEVQVGFGRVGEHFWGFELQGVVPDIVTLGKPIGNGHPLAAVVTTREIARSFETGMEYFNSFGGNPVSCAVGLAVLDAIEVEALQRNAQRVGERLKAGLRALAQRHPLIGDVRGRGLFLGVELVRDRESLEPAAEEAAWVVNRTRELGVLISRDGPLENVLKLKPPLVFSEADAERLLAVLDATLGEDFPRARAPAPSPRRPAPG